MIEIAKAVSDRRLAVLTAAFENCPSIDHRDAGCVGRFQPGNGRSVNLISLDIGLAVGAPEQIHGVEAGQGAHQDRAKRSTSSGGICFSLDFIVVAATVREAGPSWFHRSTAATR